VLFFAVALFVGCFGAAVEIALNGGYVLAQGFGWPWGANKKRLETARFSGAMTLLLAAATLFALSGFDPLRLTLLATAVTVIAMPIIVLPMMVLMNDQSLVKDHRSGPIGNGVLATLVIVGALLAIVVVPLQIVGGG
jgi:Mn2+/Fe2+ NRAMP family transporter